MLQRQQSAVVGEVVIDKHVQEEVTAVNSVDFLSHQSINYVNITTINILNIINIRHISRPDLGPFLDLMTLEQFT